MKQVDMYTQQIVIRRTCEKLQIWISLNAVVTTWVEAMPQQQKQQQKHNTHTKPHTHTQKPTMDDRSLE